LKKRGLLEDLWCVIGTYCPWLNPRPGVNSNQNEQNNHILLPTPTINDLLHPEFDSQVVPSILVNEIQEINIEQPNDAADSALNFLLPDTYVDSRQDLYPNESQSIKKETSRERIRALKTEFWNLTWHQLEDYRDRLRDFIHSVQFPNASFAIDVSLGSATELVRQDPESALKTLDAYMLVAKSNGAKKQPQQKTIEFTKADRLIAATCTLTRSELIEEPEAECASLALKKIKPNNKKIIATSSHILTAKSFYLRDNHSNQTTFNSIISGINPRNLPSNYSRDHIVAVGYDGAEPTNGNYNLFYLMDFRNTTKQRSPFGIDHILGSPNNQNNSHRQDWQLLGINHDQEGRRQLARIIMTALTSPEQPETQKKRGASNNNNLSRTYSRIVVPRMDGRGNDIYTDILIAFSMHGNVITAYPIRNAQHSIEDTNNSHEKAKSSQEEIK